MPAQGAGKEARNIAQEAEKDTKNTVLGVEKDTTDANSTFKHE